MAYSAHPTVVTGQVWSAANQNTYVKGNFDELWKYTTAGDLVYASSATALARLAAGANGKILRLAGGVPTWDTTHDLVFAGPYTNSGWNGDVKNVGNYTIVPNTFNSNIPTGISAVLLTMNVAWAGADGGRLVNITPSGSTSNGLVARAHTGYFQDIYGLMGLSGGGFNVEVIGAATTGTYLNIWGWIP